LRLREYFETSLKPILFEGVVAFLVVVGVVRVEPIAFAIYV
jgi:hypothetical protein